jgi:hypothetical protein
MNSKTLIWSVLIGFLLLGTNIKAGDVPPSPPAKLAGYVYLHGQLLKGNDGYSVKADVKGIKINGKIDSEGRYALLIPDNVGIEPGDRIEISLYQNGNLVFSSKVLDVPDFGTMKVVNLEY